MTDDLNVFFCTSAVARSPGHVRAIYIWLGDNWDDFGFKVNFQCRFIDESAPNRAVAFETELKLAFWDNVTDPHAVVLELLKEARQGLVEAKGNFFTMLPELGAYRRIVKTLGVDQAEMVLRTLRDLVNAQQQGSGRAGWFAKAVQSPAFLQAFLRSAHTFFAYHNAAPVLAGLEYESFGDISSDLRVGFQLPTFSNQHELRLTFENDGDLPRNMAVLIGKNGAGKSQSLYQIAESLLKNDERVRTASGERPQINRLVAISPASMSRRTYPPAGRRPRIVYRRIVIGGGHRSRSAGPLHETIQRLVYSSEDIGQKSRWRIFLNALQAIDPRLELGLATRPIPEGPYHHLHLSDFGSLVGRDAQLRVLGIPPRAEVVRLANGQAHPLSTGENTFVRFAAQLCLEIENGTLLLIDEPETHLHPNLITQFVVLLNSLLTMTGSFAVVATHSPFFVREVPRSQVHVLKREGTDFTVEPIRLRTLGADVGAITEFVFGDDLFDPLLARLVEKIQASNRPAAEELQRMESELPNELVMQVRRKLGLD